MRSTHVLYQYFNDVHQFDRKDAKALTSLNMLYRTK